MDDLQTKPDHIRSIFRSVLEQWPDASVTVDGSNRVDITPVSQGGPPANSALIVVGRNKLDRRLFERCAAQAIRRLLEDGWSIKLVDFEFVSGCIPIEPGAISQPGETVAEALARMERLRYVLFLTHSRMAINLSEAGNDLVVSGADEHSSLQSSSVPIDQLRLSKTAARDGWVDLFGCHCRPNAKWAQELANALNWPVRTVYPGFSIYFPEEVDDPRSAIPFLRRLSRGQYCVHGWAVWLPGSDRPVRVSEPAETTRRYADGQNFLERFLIATISVRLERVRDFRKRRRLAVQARQPRPDSDLEYAPRGDQRSQPQVL